MDTALLNKSKRIAIIGKRLSSDYFPGAFSSVFKGQGLAFNSVRPYEWGDDTRAIDWNVSARLNSLHIKTYCEERRLNVFFLIDISASCFNHIYSMQFREYVASLCATLGFSAMQSGDTAGAAFFSSEIEKYIKPKSNFNHIHRLISEILQYNSLNKNTNLAYSIECFLKIQKKSSVIFIISDFLAKNFEPALLKLTKKHDAIAVRLNPFPTADIPDNALFRIIDAESKQSEIINCASHRYSLSVNNWDNIQSNNLSEIFKNLHVDFINLSLNQNFLPPFMKLFSQRNKNLIH
jgi:uncharacterized protein (DUF58 family)